jgi:hypothetical protein
LYVITTAIKFEEEVVAIWEGRIMGRVIVDRATQEKLKDLIEPVELSDESGTVFGRFMPIPQPGDPTREPKISEEEIIRREQLGERRYSTAEVLAHLEKL